MFTLKKQKFHQPVTSKAHKAADFIQFIAYELIYLSFIHLLFAYLFILPEEDGIWDKNELGSRPGGGGCRL